MIIGTIMCNKFSSNIQSIEIRETFLLLALSSCRRQATPNIM